MKAILEFDLSVERTEFEQACNGYKWANVCSELDYLLRARIKYSTDEDNSIEIETYQKVRDLLLESLHDNGLTFE